MHLDLQTQHSPLVSPCCPYFPERRQGAKWALHLPTGTHRAAASIRRRGLEPAAAFSPSEEVCLGRGWVGVRFLSRLTGVLVLAPRADGRGPLTQVGLSVGFGVATAAASSSGEPQTSSRRRTLQLTDRHFLRNTDAACSAVWQRVGSPELTNLELKAD